MAGRIVCKVAPGYSSRPQPLIVFPRSQRLVEVAHIEAFVRCEGETLIRKLECILIIEYFDAARSGPHVSIYKSII